MNIVYSIKIKLQVFRKLLLLLTRSEKINMAILVFLSLISAIFQAIGVASVLPFLSIIMNPNAISNNSWISYVYNALNISSHATFILIIGSLVIILITISNIIAAISTWLNNRFAWNLNYRLASDLLKKYLTIPYSYFLNKNTSDLGKNILDEILLLTRYFITPLINAISGIGIIVAISITLFIVNFTITLMVSIILILFYVLAYFNLSTKLKVGGKKRLVLNTQRYKIALESLSGIKDIKVLGVENNFLNKFNEISKEYSNVQTWYLTASRLPRYFIEIIAFGGVIAIIMYFTSTGKQTTEILPILSMFVFAGYKILPYLQEVFNAFSSLKFNKSSLDRIYKDFTYTPSTDNYSTIKLTNIKPLPFNKHIKLNNISYNYPHSNKSVLKSINLTISKNSKIAVIGSTGSGKSTLIDILLGLFSPTKGTLMVDDVKIDEKNIRNWRANIGYVPQQIYLSDDTVAKNIAFGLTDRQINKNKLYKAAKAAQIHYFIVNELDAGYETVIGERGVRLSGGQRQRIGIARALYHDPKVLIFDEATSSLDSKTEKQFINEIEKYAINKTVIIVSHKLSTVKNCNKFYLIEKGGIVKSGDYNDVINTQL